MKKRLTISPATPLLLMLAALSMYCNLNVWHKGVAVAWVLAVAPCGPLLRGCRHPPLYGSQHNLHDLSLLYQMKKRLYIDFWVLFYSSMVLLINSLSYSYLKYRFVSFLFVTSCYTCYLWFSSIKCLWN